MSSYTPLDIEEFLKKHTGGSDNPLFVIIVVVLGIVSLIVVGFIGYLFYTKYLT